MGVPPPTEKINTVANNSKKSETYANANLGFSVTYPAGWKITETSGQRYSSSGVGTIIVFCRTNCESGERTVTIGKYEKTSKDQVIKTLLDRSVDIRPNPEEKNIQFQNLNATEVLYSYNLDNASTVRKAIIFDKGESTFIIDGVLKSESEFQKLDAVVTKFIDSFKLIE